MINNRNFFNSIRSVVRVLGTSMCGTEILEIFSPDTETNYCNIYGAAGANGRTDLNHT